MQLEKLKSFQEWKAVLGDLSVTAIEEFFGVLDKELIQRLRSGTEKDKTTEELKAELIVSERIKNYLLTFKHK